LGGTIVVHFIKKHMWFFETALALLEGEEETEYEVQRRLREEGFPAEEAVLSRTTAKPHRSQLEGRCTHRAC
jgi:SOS response regulatory protein OraA/RecX